MGQKAFNVYTPAAAAAHIYAEDEAQLNRARLGTISGITEADSMLACTRINDNTVRLAPGMYSNQGFLVFVSKDGDGYEDLSIDSGTIGLYRRDLVVANFIRGGGAVEDTHVFTVVKGTPAASDVGAVVPTLIQDDLPTGGAHRQEALYSVLISGTTLSTITRIAPLIGIQTAIEAFGTQISAELAAGLATKRSNMVLLWTNTANQAVPFVQQTIALDLSDYDYIDVFFNTGLGTELVFARMTIGTPEVQNYAILTGGIPGSSSIVTRVVMVDTAGITFSRGYQNSTVGDSYAIPRFIYGGNF